MAGVAVVVVVVIVALACIVLASRKGRDIRIWAVLGLVFGPVALIALLLLPSVQTGR
jgi:multisubunit Na+/H+ antiporter MnhB subunit